MDNDLLFDPHRVYPIKEFWATLGVSPRTGEREMARGNSPVITQLSSRRESYVKKFGWPSDPLIFHEDGGIYAYGSKV
jgi:hypothetical protein